MQLVTIPIMGNKSAYDIFALVYFYCGVLVLLQKGKSSN